MLKDFAKSDNGDKVIVALSLLYVTALAVMYICYSLFLKKKNILTHVGTVYYVNQVLSY